MRARIVLLWALSAACTHGTSESSGAEASAASPSEASPDAASPVPAVVVDGHVDLPYRLTNEGPATEQALSEVAYGRAPGDFDYVRAKKGGLTAPFMSIYVAAEHQRTGDAGRVADELIDLVERLVAIAPERFAIATSPDDVRSIVDSGRIALGLGIENGAALQRDLANVEHFRDRGVRYITLTHAEDNAICDSSYDDTGTWNGLSPFGHRVVERMNDGGVMVDISHVSDEAFWDVVEVTSAPIIASHSSARHFTPGFERNLSDEMIRAVARDGGVVMVNFGSTFVSQRSREYFDRRREARDAFLASEGFERDHPRVERFVGAWEAEHPMVLADVSDVADHIDHIASLVGVEHVGLGSDFDGVGPTLPNGLRSAADLPHLFDELQRRGYTEDDLRRIASENVFRVWTAVEALATF